MGEMTLDDLASDTAEAAGGSSGGDTGEWVSELYDKMSDDGYIDMFLKDYLGDERSMDEIQGNDTTPPADTTDQGGAAEPAPDIDGETVKDVLLELYDAADSIPMVSDDPKVSEIIKLIDANPDMADELIEQHL